MGELGLAQVLWELLVFLFYLIAVLFSVLVAVILLSVIILIIAVIGIAAHDAFVKRKQKKGK